MYLYICAKTDRQEIGWEYVQERVVSEHEKYKNINMMASNLYEQPSKENNEEKYLFNAARKWLITKKDFPVFIQHMRALNNRLNDVRYQVLHQYNLDVVSNYDDIKNSVSRKISNTKKNILNEFPECNIVNQENLQLSEEEIEIAIDISTYEYTVIGDVDETLYPYNLYQYWL